MAALHKDVAYLTSKAISVNLMFVNAPKDYICPFCLLAAGIENQHVSSRQSDIVYQDAEVMAFICSRQWPNNEGHVLIIPVQHYENIFTLPSRVAARIHDLSREIALVMKQVYACEGISTRQHNGASGNQEVWHYHLHVFPRYSNDCLYAIVDGNFMPAAMRADFAKQLRPFLSGWQPSILCREAVKRQEDSLAL
jgi:histidine triad (HIT) family protein